MEDSNCWNIVNLTRLTYSLSRKCFLNNDQQWSKTNQLGVDHWLEKWANNRP